MISHTPNEHRWTSAQRLLIAAFGLAVVLVACATPRSGPAVPVTAVPAPMTPAQVILEARHSNVSYLPSGSTTEKPVSEGKPLAVQKGDGVTVDLGGEAWVKFIDLLTVRVFRKSDAELDLQGIADPNLSPAESVIKLHNGAAFGILAEQANKRLSVQTKWAVVQVTGTEFWVYYDPVSEITWVVVVRGHVDVTAGGATVTVPERFQTWVRPAAPPEPPIPATRPIVGGLFPLADDLTNGALTDGFLLGNPQCTVRPASLVIRAAPDLAAAVIGTTTLSLRFEAVGRTVDNAWIFGTGAGSVQGWVDSASLNCAYRVADLPITKTVALPATVTPTITPTVAQAITPTITPTVPPSVPAIAFAVTAVQAAARQPEGNTACPTSLRFSATIQASAAGTVSYRWVGSDNYASRVLTVAFREAGSRPVALARNFTRTSAGQVWLGVIAPNDVQSNVINYAVTCLPTPIPTTPVPPPPIPTTPVPTTVSPQVSFVADTTTITAGQCTTLRWNTTNVFGVFLGGKGVASPGAQQVCPTVTTTYQLLVQFNGGGKEIYPITIVVNPSGGPSSVDFTVQPQRINPGECASVSWTTQNVKGVFFEGQGVPSPDSRKVCPQTNTTYSLRVRFNDGHEETRRVTVEVVQPNTGVFTGNWVNTNPNTGSWTRLSVSVDGTRIIAHVWGRCHPTDCDAGSAGGASSGNSAQLTLNNGFAERQMRFTLSGDTLQVTTVTHFTDNSGRKDYSSSDTFVRAPVPERR